MEIYYTEVVSGHRENTRFDLSAIGLPWYLAH